MAIAADADLRFVRQGETTVVEARVAGPEAGPLRWRLSLEAATAGGRSSISQAGATSGAGSAPVASVTVGKAAAGEVTLVVETPVGQQVAQKQCRFCPEAEPDC